MTLYRAGVLLDDAAKRLHRLFLFMLEAAADDVLEQWPDEELERFRQSSADREAAWQCAGITKNGKRKGERCGNDSLWPFDRCYSHLTAGEQDRHNRDQEHDEAELTERDYLQELERYDAAARADDEAREKRQKAYKKAYLAQQPKRGEDADQRIVEELDAELEEQYDQRRQEEADGLRLPEEELPEDELLADEDDGG